MKPLTLEIIGDRTFRFSWDGGRIWETRGITGGWQELTDGYLVRFPLSEPELHGANLGQLCHACGAHWVTDAQADTLSDAIEPWRQRALVAEARLREALAVQPAPTKATPTPEPCRVNDGYGECGKSTEWYYPAGHFWVCRECFWEYDPDFRRSCTHASQLSREERV